MKSLIAMVLVSLAFAPAAQAAGPVIRPSACTGSWTAPQLNTDGSALTNLKEYRLYIAPEQVDITTVTTPFLVIAATEADPPAGKVVTLPVGWCKTIAVGQMYAQVEAVSATGALSPRTPPYPFVLALDVLPQAPTNFQLTGP